MNDFVGYCTLEVGDAQLGLVFPLTVFYPTSTPGQAQRVGPYTLEVAQDAPIATGSFPLVLISHGTGSTPLAYRTLAHHLACRGFVVGLPEHPFNHRENNAWEGTVQNLAARPRHLQLAIGALSQHPRFAAAVQPDAVGLVGHSMGGYTALALAGGQPATTSWESASPGEPVPTPTDSRVKALVLLAPATPWFAGAGALRHVHIPVLLFEAVKDEHTTRFHGQVVLDGVPDRSQVEHRLVDNAGHFSFLSPFPEVLKNPAFPPSQDPPGFDRAQFHEILNAEIATFLARALH